MSERAAANSAALSASTNRYVPDMFELLASIVLRIRSIAYRRHAPRTTRRKSRSDGRKQALNLTAPGRRALSTAKRAIQQHERWLKSRFSAKEVLKLIEL